MLLYNQNREFEGISDNLLKQLGFDNIAQLQEMTDDFATFFVEKPGYVYNFSNFSWIDFVLFSNALEFKTVIKINEKVFSCELEINPFYIKCNDYTMQAAYNISLKNLSLTDGALPKLKPFVFEEKSSSPVPKITDSSSQKPLTTQKNRPSAPMTKTKIERDSQQEPVAMKSTQAKTSVKQKPKIRINSINKSNVKSASPSAQISTKKRVEKMAQQPKQEAREDTKLPIQKTKIAPAPRKREVPKKTTPKPLVPLFKYDPEIAADSLGLPVDLIEEFLGDFIEQSRSFRNELYESISKGENEKAQTISHKLKGVAANLRIAQAFEPLKIINTTKDQTLMLKNFNEFYAAIDILDGLEPKEGLLEEPRVSIEESAKPEFKNSTSKKIAPNIKKAPAKTSTVEDTPTEDGDFTLQENSDELYDLGISIESEQKTPNIDFDLSAISDVEDDSFELELKNEEQQPKKNVNNIVPLSYDPSIATEELGLPIDTINAFIDDFKVQSYNFKRPFKAALENNNLDTIHAMATELKGVSDTLQITTISEILSTIQNNENHSILKSIIDDLYLLIDQL